MTSYLPYLIETEAPSRAEVAAMTGLVVLEFGTDWCGHCRAAQPAIAQALAQHTNWQHIKIEDGPGHSLGRSFGVKLWPTLVLLKDGQETGRLVRSTNVGDLSTALTVA
jgi:thioredoxin 1